MDTGRSLDALQSPLVSVGLPVYNGEAFLAKAIESLLAQSYENIEIVVSDNASTDCTPKICEEYRNRDPRVKYFRNQSNIGVIKNFWAVVELSQGEYFMWAAADDIRPSKSFIEDCVRLHVENPKLVLAYGPVLVATVGHDGIKEIKNDLGKSILSRNPAIRIRAFTHGLIHNAIEYGVYRKDALVQGVYGRHYGTEYLFCLQMCLLGPLGYVSQPMITYLERVLTEEPSPMYVNLPLTLRGLLTASSKVRSKCWTVLFLGCYYLGRIRSVGWLSRIVGIGAHVLAFSARYRVLLAKELAYIVFWPLSWLAFLPSLLAQKLTHR